MGTRPNSVIAFRRVTPTRVILLIIMVAVAGATWFLFIPGQPLSEPPVFHWGVTYSPDYARWLGLDWRQSYVKILDDLGVKYLRLSVPWDQVEAKAGEYNFSEIDWMLAEAKKRNARVLLVIGVKTPRWPECRVPKYLKGASPELFRERVLTMLESTVNHLKASPVIEAWQVENEPLFQYGDCPRPDKEVVTQEIATVRSLDSRPIVITDSGELSSWLKSAPLGDILGVSVYRRVWNPFTGYVNYPLAPALYARKARFVAPRVGRIIVTELQMEPWARGSILDLPLDRQAEAFSVQDFRSNLQYVKKIGFDTVYLWGVEWWLWMKEVKGHPEFYAEAKKLFSGYNP